MFRPCILHYNVQTLKNIAGEYVTDTGDYIEPTYEAVLEPRTYPCKSQTDCDWAMAHIQSAYGVTPIIECEMTAAEYELEQSIRKGTNPEQLRADLDYIMLMEGL